MLCLVAQSCLTLLYLMDCIPPGSSVHGDSPGKKTGVGCHVLLQGIVPTPGSNPALPHCRWILYHLSHQESCTGNLTVSRESKKHFILPSGSPPPTKLIYICLAGMMEKEMATHSSTLAWKIPWTERLLRASW